MKNTQLADYHVEASCVFFFGKFQYRWTVEKINKYIKEGRGSGELENYKLEPMVQSQEKWERR
jgi:hypothetical protein